MSKAQRSNVVNGLMYACIVAGLLSNTEFGANLALSFTWTLVILSLLVFVAMRNSPAATEWRLKFAQRPRHLAHLAVILDVVVLFLLAGFGHWITFGFFLFACLLSIVLEQKCQDDLAKTKEPTS